MLFMINLNHFEVVLYVEDPQLQKSSQDIYWLTSTGKLSKYVIVILQTESPAWLYFPGVLMICILVSISSVEVYHLEANHLF